MPFVHRLGERIGDAGAHADQRGLLDAELAGDLIGGAEADARDVASQSIGVLRDGLDGLGAVGLVDPHRARGAGAVAEQQKVTIPPKRKPTAETASPQSKPTVSGPFWTGKKSAPDVPT